MIIIKENKMITTKITKRKILKNKLFCKIMLLNKNQLKFKEVFFKKMVQLFKLIINKIKIQINNKLMILYVSHFYLIIKMIILSLKLFNLIIKMILQLKIFKLIKMILHFQQF